MRYSQCVVCIVGAHVTIIIIIIIIIIILLLLLLLLLLTAVELSLGGNSPYTGTDRTSKSKQIRINKTNRNSKTDKNK